MDVIAVFLHAGGYAEDPPELVGVYSDRVQATQAARTTLAAPTVGSNYYVEARTVKLDAPPKFSEDAGYFEQGGEGVFTLSRGPRKIHDVAHNVERVIGDDNTLWLTSWSPRKVERIG